MTRLHPWDHLWVGGHLATMAAGREGYGDIRGGALACQGGRIAWVGREAELPGPPDAWARVVHHLAGAWITPGLVDCHTHLVFAGSRSGEFEARMAGATYEEIARAGGGIRATLNATRAADEDALLRAASRRLFALRRGGVTTVELKSGYGQDVDTELRMLRVARRLGREEEVDVQTTLLAAHVLPPEFEGRREDYLRLVLEEMIPRAVEAGLADALDVFCDEIAFTPAECQMLLRAGREAGLALRMHADQRSDQGGAALAARLGARSADHLEYASAAGVAAMAEAGTVAVLLPGAFHFLKERRAPPVQGFRRAGVPMAVATDLNPGSSPLASLPVAMSLACVHFGLTPEEALRGATTHAARALGLHHDRGTLEVGRKADLAIWEVDHPREISYWMGFNPCLEVVKDGEPTWSASPPSPPHYRG